MKKSILFLAIAFTIVCAASEINYEYAIDRACNSDGTDYGVEMAMMEHGFPVTWHEDITFKEKLWALKKVLFN
jgi:hypothetical protein